MQLGNKQEDDKFNLIRAELMRHTRLMNDILIELRELKKHFKPTTTTIFSNSESTSGEQIH